MDHTPSGRQCGIAILLTVHHCYQSTVAAFFQIGAEKGRFVMFPRVWMSAGRAARLVLMMGLNRVDGVSAEIKPSMA